MFLTVVIVELYKDGKKVRNEKSPEYSMVPCARPPPARSGMRRPRPLRVPNRQMWHEMTICGESAPTVTVGGSPAHGAQVPQLQGLNSQPRKGSAKIREGDPPHSQYHASEPSMSPFTDDPPEAPPTGRWRPTSVPMLAA